MTFASAAAAGFCCILFLPDKEETGSLAHVYTAEDLKLKAPATPTAELMTANRPGA